MTLPTGTVSFLFTDIEGSTRLMRELGDQYVPLQVVHHELLRNAFRSNDGRELRTEGDSFFCVFASALDACQAAAAAQRSFAEHAWPKAGAIKVRIGLHTGEALRSKEDFFGKNVILAARIAAKARGNQILVSSLLRELVSSTGEFEFGDERELELKGLSGRYRVFEVPW